MKRALLASALFGLLALLPCACAWGNGFSIYGDPVFANSSFTWNNVNMFGTHDYLAKRALEMLREQSPESAEWVSERIYLYGTELPDSTHMKESLSDRNAQYLRFGEKGDVEDDSLARMSMKRYDWMINSLKSGVNGTASKWAGAVAAYVSNAGLFSRVIEEPLNGLNFEHSVLRITDIVYPSEEFEQLYGDHIEFDGMLELISPYDAVMKVGTATRLGKKDGSCSAGWMDENYDPEDPEFIECAGRNFDNLVNAIADVLYTAHQTAVNGLEYDERAYDWERYSEWASRFDEEAASAGEEPPESGEPDEGAETGPEEKEQPPESASNASGPEGISEEAEEESPPANQTAPGEPEEGAEEPEDERPPTLWTYIIVLGFIAAVLLLTVVKTQQKASKKKGKRPKPKKPPEKSGKSGKSGKPGKAKKKPSKKSGKRK